jgi:starvation-inducible DNA-binding protein
MNRNGPLSLSEQAFLHTEPEITPSDSDARASRDIASGMKAILADVVALRMKTKNCICHMGGRYRRDYHLLLDEQACQLSAMTDMITKRIGETSEWTLRSIGDIARFQWVKGNDADYVEPLDMLAELRVDNQILAGRLRGVHRLVDERHDIVTTSLIGNWIDETKRRIWLLFESSRRDD